MTVTDTGTFVRDWEVWHRDHETKRADAYGFLAITGLHWLTGEPQRFDDAPGAWRTGPEGVTVDLDPAEDLSVDGARLSGRHHFGPIPERGSVLARSGDAVIEVARRGGNDIVRPRHPNHPTRTAYHGTPTYAPDPRWVLKGIYLPYDESSDVTVGSVVEGLRHVYSSPGEIVFGDGYRLAAFNGATPGSLHVLFTDATAGVTTYQACRSLSVAEPAPDGTVALDFNRAVNLPCAYTEFATCPLPPAGNRLSMAIEAGEKIP
jgi:uncharacterized protein (DUF1684 family)